VSFRCSNPTVFTYPLRSLVLGMKVRYTSALVELCMFCAALTIVRRENITSRMDLTAYGTCCLPRPLEQALAVSKETYIRINRRGIMCVQHQVGHPVHSSIYMSLIDAAHYVLAD
jgi:hypothetical protein